MNILADLTPNSLISGHGDKVCQFLNLLADAALKYRKHSWKQFIYPIETLDNYQPQGDQDESDEDMVLEEVKYLHHTHSQTLGYW